MKTYVDATDSTIPENQRASKNLNTLNSWSNYNYKDSNQVNNYIEKSRKLCSYVRYLGSQFK